MRLHDGQMDGNGDTEANKHTHNHINVATITTEKHTDMHVKDIVDFVSRQWFSVRGK